MPNQNRPTFRLNNPIDVRNAISNLDVRYGPYNSVQEALDNLPYEDIDGKEVITLRGIGRTVLVIENGEQVEYWFEDGVEDQHLVRKTNGGDGRSPVLREHLGWVQWKYEEEVNWTNLHKIPSDGKTPFVGGNGNWFINNIDLGVKAEGEDGEKVLLRVDSELLQWKHESDSAWKVLLDLNTLKGLPGDQVELSVQEFSNVDWISWKYVNETEWTPLVNVSDLKGDNGAPGDEVELRVLDGYIQWKYEDQDANSWVNLMSLEEISGDHPILRVKNGWVQWKLSKSPESEWADLYEFSGSGGGAGGKHNELAGLQGGIPELNEYYHLSEGQHQQLAEILYEEHTMNLGVNPTYGEKGVKTDVTFDFTINPKQDQIISVTDNHSNSYDTTSDTVTIQDVVATMSRTFTVEYDKYGEILNKTYTKTYNAYLPQWRGRHTRAEMNSYLDLSTYLGKVVQASATIENIVMPTNQYIWFASKKSDAKIYDQNEFQQTIGTWGDGVSEFYTKPLTITLNDGTTATIYLYRTRLTKTIPSTFKYTIR